jgi:transposase InsO family protein
VAIVIDVYLRRIVGWRMSNKRCMRFVLKALEQARYDRKP